MYHMASIISRPPVVLQMTPKSILKGKILLELHILSTVQQNTSWILWRQNIVGTSARPHVPARMQRSQAFSSRVKETGLPVCHPGLISPGDML